jgi:hypothetical protein
LNLVLFVAIVARFFWSIFPTYGVEKSQK